MFVQLQDGKTLVNMDTVSSIYIPDADDNTIFFAIEGLKAGYIAGKYNSKAATEYMFRSLRGGIMEGIDFLFMHSADDVDEILAKRNTGEGNDVG